MARQVNWLRKFAHHNFSGLTKSQIATRKDQLKAKALVKIKKRLTALGNRFRIKTIKWAKERTGPVYYLVVYLTPPAKFVRKEEGDGSGTGSKITPTPPTGP